MGCRNRMLLPWVLSSLVLLSAIHGSGGSVSHSPTVSPLKNGDIPPTMQAVIPSAQAGNPSDHARVEHTWPEIISPSTESQAPNVPLAAAHDLSPSHMIPPLGQLRKGIPDGGVHVKAPISASPVTLPHVPGPAMSPITSPAIFPSDPSPVVSPAPREVKNPSNTTHAPLPSLPGSSPVISPAPHEVKNPSNNMHAPSTSLPAPSPVISHVPHEVKNPSNTTHSPLPLQPGSYPVISPKPHEVKDHSNITQAPLSSHPSPSPAISSVPHDVKNPSNTTHAPPTSHPAPSHVMSHVPHDGKNSSNTTYAPSTSHRAPSPVISPKTHDVKNPSNTTYAPSTSHRAPSPVISPKTHDVKNPSNTTHAPSTSHPAPSPVISPKTHDVKNPSNTTHAPSTSHPAPSPAISSVPHAVKNPSNITHAPLNSHPTPSPAISSVPHDVKNPSNTTHAPSTLHPAPSPAISHAPHDVKNASNTKYAPSTSHPAPPPVISPATHDVKNPSNTTHGPSASHPAPSPVISPTPHEAKNLSKTAHAPLVSHRGSSTLISPAPHNANNPPYTTHAPLASHPHPPAGSILHSPASTPAISIHQHTAKKRVGNPASAPLSVLPPSSYHPVEGPVISPAPLHPPVPPKDRRAHHAPSSYVQGPSLSPIQAPFSGTVEGPVISPAPLHPPVPPKDRRAHHAPSSYVQGPSLSPIQAPFSSADGEGAPASPSSTTPWQSNCPVHSPIISPSGSFSRKPRTPSPQPVRGLPLPPPNSGPIHSPTPSPSGSLSRKPTAPSPHPIWALPPPPPNYDCNSLTCSEPLTTTPPGSPCACVFPIKVQLRLGIALYTFFPLVSELAREIAAGIFMKQSQVRIMGANAATEDPEKTIVLIDLVPLGKYFDNTTAFLIYEKFWHKQVPIQASFFGDYDVLYVLYPGLPPSPPTAPADINVDDGAYGNNGRTIHPLGVDVTKRKEKLSGSLIAVIVLSSVIALVFIIGAAWFLVSKHRDRARLPAPPSQTSLPPFAKSLVAGTRPTIFGGRPSSVSASLSSSIATYTGSVKTFSLAEMERATNRFDDLGIIGEGGFGRVYQGSLEDGTGVAVKVLKRDDQQGGREFLAEVEMLSRLHHRNLVKLIGICTEDVRCLVYELIPNGSVESHLHGVNKETSPLDWSARVKIALGAARGLAYLHEDSSPCVIHRDFKSSNILLEHDFTPKVSDFGLARTALDEGSEHISTRVMGTFGYVAPEYAMTGHLLVKSDVYSYGVVLLELLTGRKPVDMSQPLGQENLVTWARPLLTSMDGLEMIVDQALGTDVPFDSVAKVAAIASMCVQPEVTHRPFMSEVVQALKLVCNESDEYRASGSCSQEEISVQDTDIRISTGLGLEAERGLSASDIFSTSARFSKETSGYSRRHSSSGPLRTGRRRNFWQRIRGLSGGSMSEHGFASRFVPGLEDHERWP